jgi:hypothetical protein
VHGELARLRVLPPQDREDGRHGEPAPDIATQFDNNWKRKAAVFASLGFISGAFARPLAYRGRGQGRGERVEN